jgi:hypothetical protein
MKLTIEQLRSRTWTDRAAAEKDFRQSGLPTRGADYELREHVSGSWQVMPLSDDDGTELPKQPPVTGAKRSPLARIRSAPIRLVEAVEDEAIGSSGLFPEIPPGDDDAGEEAPEAPPEDNGTDLSFLPQRGPGYYAVVIEADHIRHTSPVLHALEIAKKLRLPVVVCGPDGEIARRIDPAAIAQAKRGRRSGNGIDDGE